MIFSLVSMSNGTHIFLLFRLSIIYCRVFVNTLQHYVLNTFRKVLVSSPVLLEVFREEGIWDLIFSENFFYFGPALEELSAEYYAYNEGSPRKPEIYATSSSTNSQVKSCGVEILQMEVISFIEYVATSDGSAHNLVGASLVLNLCIAYFSSLSEYVLSDVTGTWIQIVVSVPNTWFINWSRPHLNVIYG